ncbi:MAG: bifunctional phosphoribosylaminoimidazolecarboxamide formyltransferase/IMP cyclohydrolase PurH [Euryarchaeota archaeon]|nr:bifunctional phosphoribosylaminoimidazolecarboxamide formyltransferase/IMP cyclohydrolase PurH [Euryarchaeota archaeon]
MTMNNPRAILSVWNKESLVPFAKSLVDLGWTIISTGGTSRELRNSGIEIIELSEYTKHPEIFDGRVKTLHPAIHGGILARKSNTSDMSKLVELGYSSIDLVCVNLYPFEETSSRNPPVEESELIEMIDIGGPTMIRSAAKNFEDVIVLTNPNQYQNIIDDLTEHNGYPSGITEEKRKKLALEAFERTSEYDLAISTELNRRFNNNQIPKKIKISTKEGTRLRYGENPHQPASFYPDSSQYLETGLAAIDQHSGKQLSFNNYLDLDGTLRILRSLMIFCKEDRHGCVIVKHSNPSGVAVDAHQVKSWKNALLSDPESAFGCVIGFTHTVTKATAEMISEHFFECILAPDFEQDALSLLSSKKNRRIISIRELKPRIDEVKFRQIEGGWLAQIQGPPSIEWDEVKSVTDNKMDEYEIELARFGIIVISEVKSNAIILVKKTDTGFTTVGIGPGQTSRIEAVKIAARRAGKKSEKSMMISDAFFPFKDAIDLANEIGISSIVQPGGSIRDQESIDAANEHGISMIFTGKRLFLH